MPIEFLCPQCQTLLQTPDDSAGLHATCPQCNLTMLVPGPAPAEPAYPPAAEQPIYPPGYQPPSEPTTPAGAAESAPAPVSPSPSVALADRTPAPTPAPAPARAPAATELAAAGLMMDEGAILPMPRQFSVYGSLAYGWEVMKLNFSAFCLAAIAFTLLSSMLIPVPLLLAGMGALSVRAARGSHPDWGVVLSGLNDLPRVYSMMMMWIVLTLVLHIPLFAAWGVLLWTQIRILQLIGMLMFFGGGILYGVRFGWVPFAVLDRPHLTFPQLVEHSLAISKNRSYELVQLAGLTYFALAATAVAFGVGFVFFGIPIALGVGGSAYVLLVRDTGK